MPDDDQIAQKSGSECTNVTIYVNKEKKIGNVMLTSSFNKVVEQVQVSTSYDSWVFKLKFFIAFAKEVNQFYYSYSL